MSTFKYKIRSFDQKTKIVTVDFDDGSWAEVPLSNPLPRNLEELDDIVKHFTASIETMQARQSPDTDLTYIEESIGKERTANRLSELGSAEAFLIPELDVEPIVSSLYKSTEIIL